MFCTNCGASFGADSKFCVSCGHKVDDVEIQSKIPTPAITSTTYPTAVKPKGIKKIYLMLAILVLVGTGVAIFIFTGGGSQINLPGVYDHLQWSGTRFPSLQSDSSDMSINIQSNGRFTTVHIEHDGNPWLGDGTMNMDVIWHRSARGIREYLGQYEPAGSTNLFLDRYFVAQGGDWRLVGNVLELTFDDGVVQQLSFRYGEHWIELNGVGFSRRAR